MIGWIKSLFKLRPYFFSFGKNSSHHDFKVSMGSLWMENFRIFVPFYFRMVFEIGGFELGIKDKS